MSHYRSGSRLCRLLVALSPKIDHEPSGPRARQRTEIESLEGRALMASITGASAVITSAPVGANFDYTVDLTDSSGSAAIGTFWYSWVPGKDFLASSPLSVSPPVGWTHTITHGGATDGYAIQFVASSPAYDVQPGSSMNSSFESADTPASVDANSPFYPGVPVRTSFVYPGAPLSRRYEISWLTSKLGGL